MRSRQRVLGPSLLLAAGIVLSTLVSSLTSGSPLLVLCGPLLLALATVSADALSSRLSGGPYGPSWAALILAGSFLLAGWIVSLADPRAVQTFMPIMGGAGSVTILTRPENRHGGCRSV